MLKNQNRREFIKYGLGSLVGFGVGEEGLRLFARSNMHRQYSTLQKESVVYQNTLNNTSTDTSWNYEDLIRLEEIMQEMKSNLCSNPTLTSFCEQYKRGYGILESEIKDISSKLEEVKSSIESREITVVSETGERYIVTGTPAPIDLKTINLDERIRNVVIEYAKIIDSKELKDYVERDAPQNNPKEFIMGFVDIFRSCLSGEISL